MPVQAVFGKGDDSDIEPGCVLERFTVQDVAPPSIMDEGVQEIEVVVA